MSSYAKTVDAPLSPPPRRRRSWDLPYIFGSSAIVWQMLFFYGPLLFLLISSFFEPESLTFTAKHFAELLTPSYGRVILGSIQFALVTSVITLTLGFSLAYFLAFQSKNVRNFLLFLLIIPFWTNFLLHIYAWFFVLEKGGFLNTLLLKLHLISEPLHMLNTPFAVMVMMVYYFLPFAVLPIYFSLERFDKTLLDASYDLGGSFRHTFLRILLPMNLRSIRGAFFLVFIPAYGEFIIPELMGGDKTFYVGNVISQFVFGETTAALGAAFTILSVAALLIASAALYFGFSRLERYLKRSAA